jgi:APA family basic amino acid/polyamine antiporter
MADTPARPTGAPDGNVTGLRRQIGLFQLSAYGIGNIIGAGIYVLVGEAAGVAGNMVWLAFLAGALVALCTGLNYAELGAMYPRAASEYVYLGRAYGSRLLSFLTQWTMLMTEVIAAAAVSLGFASYMAALTGLPTVPVAIALILGLTALGMLGMRESLRLNTALSLIAIAGLLVVIAAGVGDLGSVSYTAATQGIDGILAATTIVFFAYIGFDNIANLSEETVRPEKTIPRALIISVAVSTVLYVLVGLTAVSLVPWQELSESEAPLALAASRVLGESAFNLLAIAALLTTTNTVLVLLIVSSRIIYGMAREGALPSVLGRVSPKAQTPLASLILVALIALAFLSFGDIGVVARITSFGSLFTFALVNLAMLHLRRVAPRLDRPFRAPFAIGWVSVTGLLGLVSCLAMMTRFDWLSVLLGLVLPISGAVIWVVFSRRHQTEGAGPLHQPHEH